MTVQHAYKCVRKRCREYGKARPAAMGPGEYRRATGSAVRCDACGDVVRYVPRELCAYRDCNALLPGQYGEPGVSLSRADNRTLICAKCGVREAMQPALLQTGFAGDDRPEPDDDVPGWKRDRAQCG